MFSLKQPTSKPFNMNILLTGATGYIGKRLLPALVQDGHHVICGTRDTSRFNPPKSLLKNIDIIELDLLDENTLDNIPDDIDGAYYLVHSMSGSENYSELEERCARNFVNRVNATNCQQTIYLSGMVNEEELSKHLSSRKNVENILNSGNFHLTTLRAGIIIGSGSASFEIIRDLVEKLPVMITPKWVKTKCQPIGVRDVIKFLTGALHEKRLYDNNYDIAGPDVLTYKEMMLGFAEARGLTRYIFTVPVMTPRLSSYWLYFITSTSYRLATSLVDSMKINVVARNDEINHLLNIHPESYQTAINRAFTKVESNEIASSWKDAFVSGGVDFDISDFINVPTHGCFKDKRRKKVDSVPTAINRIWRIGGYTGWYHGNFLWRIRGFMDKLVGGVGLRRGRTNEDFINPGDALDFWRVLFADKKEGRLLLFAEMKLPGEAWLEFEIKDKELVQTATFRPHGILGRLYWYSVLPFHGYIFEGMVNKLAGQ